MKTQKNIEKSRGNNENRYDIIIIGSGPAGLTAGLYASRANLSVLCIEGKASQAGGQLMLTSDVENYPGFPKGILGPEMMKLFRDQAERFGTKYLTKNVTKVDLSGTTKKVWVDTNVYEAKAVIIATGASALWLRLENEKLLQGRGVSGCATCDAYFFKDKKVVVVGGGDSAMEESLTLAKFASSIAIVHRRDEFRASKIMQDRVLNNKKITVIWDSTVVDVLDVKKGKVTGVKIQNLKTRKITEYQCDGLFVAIGHKPNTDLFKGIIEVDEKGFILTKGKSTQTNIKGVFACGDVQDHVYKQAVTAAGTGCMAALDAERYLETLKE
ncbi:thioredoxin-disulfide reductase [Candidatus Woesearchaeota archaeon]|nr:thioredoxin-disulfide reductase [Candidatus Woesearchaeota archaeon]